MTSAKELASLIAPNENGGDIHRYLATLIAIVEKRRDDDSADDVASSCVAWMQTLVANPNVLKTSNKIYENRIKIADTLKDIARRSGKYDNIEYLKSFRDCIISQIDSSEKIGGEDGSINVLAIGDCLVWDALVELQKELIKFRIKINPIVLASRNPADLRRQVSQYVLKKEGIIIYSPVTYGFSSAYVNASGLLWPKWIPGLHRRIKGETINIVETLAMIPQLDSLAVALHLPSGGSQWRVSPLGLLKVLWTWPIRRLVAAWISARLVSLTETERDRLPRLILLHEKEYYRTWKAGLVKNNLGELHPTEFSRVLGSRGYASILLAWCRLRSRKVLVVDLDNTLWHGIMAEGPVVHLEHRQVILTKLKEAGIVLAIASKNDPRNINWNGSRLSSEMFAVSEISWSRKSASISRIASVLNLAHDAIVFIDDREDERQIVEAGCPGVLCLDAEEELWWSALDYWSKIADKSTGDRTQLYQQRAERMRYIEVAAQSSDDDVEMTKLGLRAQICVARPDQMRRAVELINRTNQFNINGIRVGSQDDVAGPGLTCYLLSAQDRFGEMGIVGCAVISSAGEIRHFVLSCRAFGFEFEFALIARIISDFKTKGIEVFSEIVDTPRNLPCRDVFLKAGFQLRSPKWVCVSDSTWQPPDWLEIEQC